ncbi:DNA repair protein RadA [Candidatus Saccharibacteria bacterium RIFCSPHIGHO2_12_FULL_41_12]|nr:MAG: DNA repair protein RadA [Candidatus Saccharibacteria bacterium RIFCSPHIGHO2_12_FULL_41_12]
MAKKGPNYVCRQCGYSASSWSGKCPSCDAWNALEETITLDSNKGSSFLGSAKALEINDNWGDLAIQDQLGRIKTDIADVDLVLGGGFAPASVNLLVGQPGIGKSTLTMQIAASIAKKRNVLYVSGEESVAQVGARATRLGATKSNLHLVASNSCNDIAKEISGGKYGVVIVDSIQTIGMSELSSNTGSVSQITNSTNLIMNVAKKSGTTVVMIGHVTKEGAIAGPKILEHIVDVVMQLEGDRYDGFKILRAVKNRYGSTTEAGIFEMQESGLQQVTNPSQALLNERVITDGSIILATVEGSRPLLVEVQALVNESHFGYPKRASSGFDLNRLNLLIAVLEKRTKLNLSTKDIYINIVGGIKLSDPAADLAVVMAIASASKGLALKSDAVVFGEVGLSGEIRHVSITQKRINEAVKLGYKHIVGPKITAQVARTAHGSKYHQATDIKSTLNEFLKKE